MRFERGWSTFEMKALTETAGKRRFSGIATVPVTDRVGDIVEPKGANFKLPLPLLWMHDSRDPIGWVTAARVTANGIEIEGEVADFDEDGDLKKRLTLAWQYLKAKLVRGLSIGFNVMEEARIEATRGYHILKWEWLELSPVTIPANQEATITAVKTLYRSPLAALGTSGGSGNLPGASGSRKGEGKMKTLRELKEAREQKAARMKELLELRESEKRALTDEEGAEFDGLQVEVRGLDDEIRVAQFHAINSAGATPVEGKSTDGASASRGGVAFVRKNDPDEDFKGQAYTRMVIAQALAFMGMKSGSYVSPEVHAERRWGKKHPNMVRWIKAAVAGGGTGSGEWGAELAGADRVFTGDFVEFLYSRTVFDRLPLRPVPARVHIRGQDGAMTGYWVGESKAIPVGKPDFSDVELSPLKVAAIAVCSKELVTDSQPSAEMFIRDSLVQASSQRVDTTFLGQAAASAGVSPAGIGNGLTAIVPSGTDADAVRNDLMALYLPFLAAKTASGLVQVMTPSMAKALQLLRNSLGQREFPDIRADGGTLEGDPVFTGDNVAGGDWYLLKPSDIWKIDDRGVQVSMSDQATIEQNDAPQGAGDTPTAASATLMSLWQTEQVGFKIVRPINYQKRRTSAAALLQNAEYGGIVS